MPARLRLDNSAVRNLQLSTTLTFPDVSKTLTFENDKKKIKKSSSINSKALVQIVMRAYSFVIFSQHNIYFT